MSSLTRRSFLVFALTAAGGVVAACSAAGPAGNATTPTMATPVTSQQTSAMAPAAAPAAAAGAPPAGPNLLAKGWPEHLGVVVSPLNKATGTPILQPKDGDLYFFSNASTTWGATNTKNAVWVIDAKTKKTVAEVAPPDGAGMGSHGIAVSGDGKFIYLPQLGPNNHVDVLDGRTFEVVQTITTLGRPHHWKLWHDSAKNKDFIIGEDFNWNYQGSGIYAFDPSENNALVGGMSNGDFEGNPYVTTPSPDGSLIAVTVPAPDPSYRDKIAGVLAKVDPKTWKIAGIAPMIDPLWAEVTLDNKYAYVTSGGESRVHKINLATMLDEGYVATGPGPWGARISYDQTKLYTADKGEGPGYNQQGHTATIIDLETFGVVKAVDIGLTTDHAILSPDGKEIWFTSNAEHSIYVLDTKSDTIATVIKDPADGDIHGGVFVQYKDDGKGNVTGEVVADYSGLHGTALAAQRQYVSEPSLTIGITRTGFLQKSVMATAGQATRLTIKNVAGTYAGKATFESKDLGVDLITLAPGESKEIRWTAPAQPVSLKATTNLTPNKDLTIMVMAAQPKAVAAAPATTGPRQIAIHAKGFLFDVQSVDVKAGETVAFVVSNGDDEKHNLVGTGGPISLLSPDIASGATVTYQWTAPSTPGQFTVMCAYHPQMSFKLNVQ